MLDSCCHSSPAYFYTVCQESLCSMLQAFHLATQKEKAIKYIPLRKIEWGLGVQGAKLFSSLVADQHASNLYGLCTVYCRPLATAAPNGWPRYRTTDTINPKAPHT